jgi:hypothetical protein
MEAEPGVVHRDHEKVPRVRTEPVDRAIEQVLLTENLTLGPVSDGGMHRLLAAPRFPNVVDPETVINVTSAVAPRDVVPGTA